MAHKMGLANIKMAGATAAGSKETLTLSANTTTTQYSSSTTNNAFYALDEFVTNLPYKKGTRNTSGLCCYFIVNIAKPANSYIFSTSYKYGDSDTYRQWNNITISSSSNPVASGKYKEITTSVPKFKNLGRLYSYMGSSQTYTPILIDKKYQMECWGAQGGNGLTNGSASNPSTGGKGGYSKGIRTLTSNNIRDYPSLYIYVGQMGSTGSISSTPVNGGWNGGGKGYWDGGDDEAAGGGGGATDIRLTNGSWNNVPSLCSRIMVAGGGGGGDYQGGLGGAGGGLKGRGTYIAGYTSTDYINLNDSYIHEDDAFGNVSTQTSGYSFGTGESKARNTSNYPQGGGGGGYYGGFSSNAVSQSYVSGYCVAPGFGGSGFVSGHSGCNAISASVTNLSNISHSGNSVHYSEISFSSTKMIDGWGYTWTTTKGAREQMPNPTTASSKYDTGVGHTGNGYARITIMPYD